MGPAFPSPLKIFHIWLTITLLNRIPVNILTDCNVHKNSFSNILVFQGFFDLFSFFTSNAQFHCHVFSIGAVHFISGIPLFFGSYIPHWHYVTHTFFFFNKKLNILSNQHLCICFLSSPLFFGWINSLVLIMAYTLIYYRQTSEISWVQFWKTIIIKQYHKKANHMAFWLSQCIYYMLMLILH